MTPAPDPLAPGLATLREDRAEGVLAPQETAFAPGVVLHADPAMALQGQFRSPAGRLLELEVVAAGQGGWLALHVAVVAPSLPLTGWLGFACQGAAAADMVIRPCLRSATETGFDDIFFPRHILTGPETTSHVDALPLATTPGLPADAPWRELVLFLPRQPLTWHLHDLRLFLT